MDQGLRAAAPPLRITVPEYGENLLNRQSQYRTKIEGVGWEFRSLRRHWEGDGTLLDYWRSLGPNDPMKTGLRRNVIIGTVTCMCGRTETFYLPQLVSVELLRQAKFRHLDDVWEHLYDCGLFGPEHLRADGYPDEVVQRAERMYRGY